MTEYRAIRPLFVGRTRAHNPGAIVSAERVKKFGWEEDVEKISKAEETAAAPPKERKPRKAAAPRKTTTTRKQTGRRK